MDYQSLEKDDEGYLLFPEHWNLIIAGEIAESIDIDMNADRWYVVNFIREYFDERQSVPELRVLLKHLKENVGTDKATRKYIYKLFPYGYGQQACKIAGMRKPLKLMLDI